MNAEKRDQMKVVHTEKSGNDRIMIVTMVEETLYILIDTIFTSACRVFATLKDAVLNNGEHMLEGTREKMLIAAKVMMKYKEHINVPTEREPLLFHNGNNNFALIKKDPQNGRAADYVLIHDMRGFPEINFEKDIKKALSFCLSISGFEPGQRFGQYSIVSKWTKSMKKLWPLINECHEKRHSIELNKKMIAVDSIRPLATPILEFISDLLPGDVDALGMNPENPILIDHINFKLRLVKLTDDDGIQITVHKHDDSGEEFNALDMSLGNVFITSPSSFYQICYFIAGLVDRLREEEEDGDIESIGMVIEK